MQQAQQQFTISQRQDGTWQVEVTAPNAPRRKLDTSWGLEAAIQVELNRVTAERKTSDIAAAQKAAQAMADRHVRIVAYARKNNPTTLQYLEPKARKLDTVRRELDRRLYSPAAIAEMERAGLLGQNTRKPPERPSTANIGI